MGNIEFEKYKDMGAYHWSETSGNIFVLNAFVLARYEVVLNILSKLNLDDNSTILDVGCGDGALTGYLYSNFKSKVYGVDNNTLAIELAQSKFAEKGFKGEFSLIDGYRSDYKDNYFDVIVCADVIEHVKRPESMLREMKRILKPGGSVVISTPIRLKEVPDSKYHEQEWFEDEFRVFIGKVYSETAELTVSHPMFWFEIYRKAYLNGGLWKVGRIVINLFAKLGMNVFLGKKSWSCYMNQTWVLTKADKDFKR